MRYCTKCGKEMPEGAAFCSFCGSSAGGKNQGRPQKRRIGGVIFLVSLLCLLLIGGGVAGLYYGVLLPREESQAQAPRPGCSQVVFTLDENYDSQPTKREMKRDCKIIEERLKRYDPQAWVQVRGSRIEGEVKMTEEDRETDPVTAYFEVEGKLVLETTYLEKGKMMIPTDEDIKQYAIERDMISSLSSETGDADEMNQWIKNDEYLSKYPSLLKGLGFSSGEDAPYFKCILNDEGAVQLKKAARWAEAGEDRICAKSSAMYSNMYGSVIPISGSDYHEFYLFPCFKEDTQVTKMIETILSQPELSVGYTMEITGDGE